MPETKVGVRDLKSKLSEYLHRVKAGETIIVTEYGRAIGQIVPISPTIEERLQRLTEAGQVEWNGQRLPSYQPKATNRSHRQLSDLVLEDRE
jgi:prevent-host-death family protein